MNSGLYLEIHRVNLMALMHIRCKREGIRTKEWIIFMIVGLIFGVDCIVGASFAGEQGVGADRGIDGTVQPSGPVVAGSEDVPFWLGAEHAADTLHGQRHCE